MDDMNDLIKRVVEAVRIEDQNPISEDPLIREIIDNRGTKGYLIICVAPVSRHIEFAVQHLQMNLSDIGFNSERIRINNLRVDEAEVRWVVPHNRDFLRGISRDIPIYVYNLGFMDYDKAVAFDWRWYIRRYA
jgi:hypothetical protein